MMLDDLDESSLIDPHDIDDSGVLDAYLRLVLTQLRQEFARRLKEQRQRFPNMKLPCETCAFRSGTDGHVGFELTIINFISAMHQGVPFYCHHNFKIGKDGNYILPKRLVFNGPQDRKGHLVPNEREMHYCSAWFTLSSDPPVNLNTFMSEEIQKVCAEIARAEER